MGPIGKLNLIWFRNCNENLRYFGGVFWSILVHFFVHFEVILVHFWVMLGLWGPFWGPLTPLGAILGPIWASGLPSWGQNATQVGAGPPKMAPRWPPDPLLGAKIAYEVSKMVKRCVGPISPSPLGRIFEAKMAPKPPNLDPKWRPK